MQISRTTTPRVDTSRSLPGINGSTADYSAGDKTVIPTLLTMTLVTGLVDAVSYLGLGHVFTANMTGNVVLLGFAVGGAPQLSVARSLTSLFAFVLGAVLGGRLSLTFSAAGRRSWLLKVGACEAALLFIAALACVGLNAGSNAPTSRIYIVIVMTAAAMGLAAAAVRRLGAVDIRTTVLTSTLAAVAGDSALAGGSDHHLGRRVASILCMLAGAAAGALMLRFGLALSLVVGGMLVLGVASAGAWLPN